MKTLGCALVVVLLVAACSSARNRNAERSTAYEALPPATKELVENGRIEAGMDTNAVFLAWGPPSSVSESEVPGGKQLIWVYSGGRPVQVPAWSSLPEPKGYGELQYNPNHYSGKFTKAQVLFQDGHVVAYKKF